MIQVVAGVLVEKGRVLITQRPAGATYPFGLETPGGKSEGDESPDETIRREMHEEVGIQVGMIYGPSLWEGQVELDDGRPPIRIHFRVIQSWSGRPEPKEGQGLVWLSPSELIAVKSSLLPGNKIVLDRLVSLIEAKHAVEGKPTEAIEMTRIIEQLSQQKKETVK